MQNRVAFRTRKERKPDKLIARELKTLREEEKLTPDLVFRDPYLLGFLGLKDTYAEKDLESAILQEMESFMLEPGIKGDLPRGEHATDAWLAGYACLSYYYKNERQTFLWSMRSR